MVHPPYSSTQKVREEGNGSKTNLGSRGKVPKEKPQE